ncbi:MAG: hypothetical protein HZA46_04630 [Planctomycetales bacterium]|nr:hypothetical protein [Planctomycetales bacterium]
MSSGSPPKSQDEQHLDLIVILHYVVAGMFVMSGLSLVFAIGMIKQLFLVILKVGYDIDDLPPEANEVLDQKMPIVVGSFVALCWVHAGVVAWFGKKIARRQYRRLCLVFEVLHCIAIPVGTALSILTILALRRPSVKAMFETAAKSPT